MSNHSSPIPEKKLPLDNGLETQPSAGENDPCLKTSSRKDHNKFSERVEERLREKTGLSRHGLIVAGVVLLVLFLLFITVIVLAICWPRTPHTRQFPICKDAACLRAVSQIREGLNTSVSPCDNIIDWSCGNWLKTHKIPSDTNHWSRKVELYRNELIRAHELITTLSEPLDHKSAKYKIKRFYDSCMNVENIEADGIQVLSRKITELGGWNVLRDWNKNDWDYRRVMERLHSRYGVTPFIKISVVSHPHSSESNVIKIEPAGLGLPDKSFYYLESNEKIIQAYKRLIRDVVMAFQASSQHANTFSENMFHFEKRLAEVTPDTIALQDPVALHNLISISELKITAGLLPLEEIIQSIFPQGKITDDTEILVTSMDYLSSVSVLISTTEQSALNDYFMWCFTREYLTFLSSNILAELNQYTTELTGIRKPIQRWELCIESTRKFIGFGIATLLEHEHNKNLHNHDYELINNVFESVRRAAKSIVADMDLPAELDKHIKYKLTSMGIQTGFPDNILTEKYLADYYDNLFIQKSNLFQSVLNGFDFLNVEKQRRYTNPKMEDKIIPYLIEKEPEISYSYSSNTIVVPKLFLKESFYHLQYPRSVIYGRLGFELSKAVASSILPFGSMWRAESTLLPQHHPAYSESVTSITEPVNCITKAISNDNITVNVYNLTALNAFKHIIAVDIAHRALGISLLNMPHTHQATLEMYEDSAIFFLTYVQEHCSKYLPEYEFLENKVKYHLTDMQQLKLSWHQVDDFAKSLDCEPDVERQCF